MRLVHPGGKEGGREGGGVEEGVRVGRRSWAEGWLLHRYRRQHVRVGELSCTRE